MNYFIKQITHYFSNINSIFWLKWCMILTLINHYFELPDTPFRLGWPTMVGQMTHNFLSLALAFCSLLLCPTPARNINRHLVKLGREFYRCRVNGFNFSLCTVRIKLCTFVVNILSWDWKIVFILFKNVKAQVN